jgi:hypothetical protein
MACDGEIAKEELVQLKAFSEQEHLFGSINIDEEYNKCLVLLKQLGNDFVKSYLQLIGDVEFAEEEKLKLLEVAAKTILADNKVEYSEIKFFKKIFYKLNIDENIVLSSLRMIEDFWLERDLSDCFTDENYFANIDFSLTSTNSIEL